MDIKLLEQLKKVETREEKQETVKRNCGGRKRLF